jgi:hypothetical protein
MSVSPASGILSSRNPLAAAGTLLDIVVHARPAFRTLSERFFDLVVGIVHRMWDFARKNHAVILDCDFGLGILNPKSKVENPKLSVRDQPKRRFNLA